MTGSWSHGIGREKDELPEPWVTKKRIKEKMTLRIGIFRHDSTGLEIPVIFRYNGRRSLFVKENEK